MLAFISGEKSIMITEPEPDDLAHRCAIEHLEFINEEGGRGKLQPFQKSEVSICRCKNRPSAIIRWDHRNKCYVCLLASARVEGGYGTIVVSMSWRVVAFAFDIMPWREFHRVTCRIVSSVVCAMIQGYVVLCCVVLCCVVRVLCVLCCVFFIICAAVR